MLFAKMVAKYELPIHQTRIFIALLLLHNHSLSANWWFNAIHVSNYGLASPPTTTFTPCCKAITERKTDVYAVRRFRKWFDEWPSVSFNCQYIRISSNQIASWRTQPRLSPARWEPVRITWTVSFFSNSAAQIHSLFPDFGARVRAVNSNTPHRIGITEAENEWTRPLSSLWISVRQDGMACHLPVELYLSHRFVQIWVSIPRLSNPSSLVVKTRFHHLLIRNQDIDSKCTRLAQPNSVFFHCISVTPPVVNARVICCEANTTNWNMTWWHFSFIHNNWKTIQQKKSLSQLAITRSSLIDETPIIPSFTKEWFETNTMCCNLMSHNKARIVYHTIDQKRTLLHDT